MKMILIVFTMLAVTVSAEEVAQPVEEPNQFAKYATDPYVLTLLPEFVEFVTNYYSREECIAVGVEWVTKSENFDGFLCAHGRAWQKKLSETR